MFNTIINTNEENNINFSSSCWACDFECQGCLGTCYNYCAIACGTNCSFTCIGLCTGSCSIACAANCANGVGIASAF